MSKRNELLKKIKEYVSTVIDNNIDESWCCYEMELLKEIEAELGAVDLVYESMKQLEQAASESNWIPKDCFANDWISCCCEFLKEGPEAFIPREYPGPPPAWLSELQVGIKVYTEHEKSELLSSLEELPEDFDFNKFVEGKNE